MERTYGIKEPFVGQEVSVLYGGLRVPAKIERVYDAGNRIEVKCEMPVREGPFVDPWKVEVPNCPRHISVLRE